ncbi:MAG TPA: hypothetical protein VI386_17900 [Candidatus Sulfotelmatobacter sp.]
MSQRAIKLPKPSPQPRHIMVAVLSEEERRGWVNPRLVTTLLRIAFDRRFKITYTPIHACYPVSAARNLAVELFLKSDAETLVFFDNDVYPPDNIADAIASMPPKCDVAVMPYWIWGPDNFTVPCFGRWTDGMMVAPDPATIKPGWQIMGSGGTGCMFIRRRVFTSGKLEEPFFKIISDAHKGQVVSEDVYFTGHVTDSGMQVWINADFICSHLRTIDLKEVNMGIVKILDRFTRKLTESYGDNGVKLCSLIQELHPELKEAAEAFEAGKATP